METQHKFLFPILTLMETRPLLIQNAKVFAYELKATTLKGDALTIYENKGLDLSSYHGQELECLLEITRGVLQYKDEHGKTPPNTITFNYQWWKRLYEYFPSLVKLKDNINNADNARGDAKRQKFESSANRLYKTWGLNGLDIGVFQAKPLLSSKIGFFLLNEFAFEEELEDLELNEEIYIDIKEIYLRGIRPCMPKQIDVPRQETKKGRFRFSVD